MSLDRTLFLGAPARGLFATARWISAERVTPAATGLASCQGSNGSAPLGVAFLRAATMLERRRREVMEPWGAFVAGGG